MLKDADFSYFPAVYVVCGHTDSKCGIDSLAASIERKYNVSLFVSNTLFLFCGRSSTRINGLCKVLQLIHFYMTPTQFFCLIRY